MILALSDSLDKRTRGWHALKGLWGKKRKRSDISPKGASELTDSSDRLENLEANKESSESSEFNGELVKRSIPILTDNELTGLQGQ